MVFHEIREKMNDAGKQVKIIFEKKDFEYGQFYALNDCVSKAKNNTQLIFRGSDYRYKMTNYPALDAPVEGIVIGCLGNGEFKYKYQYLDGFVVYNDEIESEHLLDHIFLVFCDHLDADHVYLDEDVITKVFGGRLAKAGCLKNENEWSLEDRAGVILNILSYFDFEKATDEEKEILLRTRHNMVDILVGKARKIVLDMYENCGDETASRFAQGYNDGKIEQIVSKSTNPFVRACYDFKKRAEKMVYGGSLSDAIEFYKTEPTIQKEKIYSISHAEEIKQQIKEHKKQEKEEREQMAAKKKANKRKQEHYKL